MCTSYITLFTALIVSTISTDTQSLVSTNENTTEPFRVVPPKDGLITIIYAKPPTVCSIILYADTAMEGVEFSVESTNMDVVTFPGHVTTSPCQVETNWTLDVNSSLSTSDQYTIESEQEQCYNLTFYGKSEFLGYSIIKLFAQHNNTDIDVYVGEVPLRSIRGRTILNFIFEISIVILVMVVSLAMGIDLEFEIIKEHLRRPKAPIIAMLSQFVIMPLLAYSIIHIMGYTGATALGFFAFGCSPGGGSSNMYAKLFNGNMTLSVTLTALSTIAALVMVPAWLYTLGTTIPFEDGANSVQLPFLNILQSLAYLIIPILIGALIKYKLPRVARVIKKCIKVFFVFAITFFLTFGLYVNRFIFFGWNGRLLLGACLLPYSGYMFGALFAWICRLDWSLIKTVSLETGMQNVSLSILIVQSVAREPDSDLAIMLPVTASIVTTWPLYVAIPFYLGRQKCLNKKKAKLEAELKASELQNEDEVKISMNVNGSDKSESEESNGPDVESNDLDVEMKLMDH